MTQKPNLLSPFQDSRDSLAEIISELNELGLAFGMTGNNKIQNQMYDIVRDLENISKVISKGETAVLDFITNGAEQASQNMLKACLAGAALVNKNE